MTKDNDAHATTTGLVEYDNDAHATTTGLGDPLRKNVTDRPNAWTKARKKKRKKRENRHEQADSKARRQRGQLKKVSKTLIKARQKYDNPSDLDPGDWIDPDGALHKFRQKRQAQDRDTKIIITSRNSQTGTGKTTLGTWLALNWDYHGFAIDKATLNPQTYIDRYLDTKPGSVLLLDEAEQLDARRSMSQKNIDFAERWMQLRYRMVDTIIVLPTASALDVRLEELADIWINVERPGRAKVHKTTVHDQKRDVNQIPMQYLTWPDISDHDVKQGLDKKKIKKVEEKNEAAKQADGRKPEEIEQDSRNDLIKSFYKDTELSQRDIADVVDVGKSRVAEIVKDV